MRWGLAAFAIVAAVSCSPFGSRWKVIGEITDGFRTQFVQVEAGAAKDREVYDQAIASICRNRKPCAVAFFLPGDRVPATQTSKDFYGAGGWERYPVLAMWMTDDFTRWDCVRAGVEGSPPSALCGAGVSEAYSAVLALGGRAGMAKACGWPPNDDADVALAYIEGIKDLARKQMFRKGFYSMFSTRGPDDRADCIRLRDSIEQRSRDSRKVLGR